MSELARLYVVSPLPLLLQFHSTRYSALIDSDEHLLFKENREFNRGRDSTYFEYDAELISAGSVLQHSKKLREWPGRGRERGKKSGEKKSVRSGI